jgi:hypothetical protein
MKRTIVTILTATLGLFGAGATVAAPPADAAAGQRILAVAYEHAWLGGASFNIYVTDQGECDPMGYTKEIINNDWKNRISSIRAVPGSVCSMVIVHQKTRWNTRSGVKCYHGSLPIWDLTTAGNGACNDNVWGITVYKGPRA